MRCTLQNLCEKPEDRVKSTLLRYWLRWAGVESGRRGAKGIVLVGKSNFLCSKVLMRTGTSTCRSRRKMCVLSLNGYLYLPDIPNYACYVLRKDERSKKRVFVKENAKKKKKERIKIRKEEKEEIIKAAWKYSTKHPSKTQHPP